MLKRYLAFQGENYYPSGGWGDFVGSYSVLDNAIYRAKTMLEEDFNNYVPNEVWWHVVDTDKGCIVACSGSDLESLKLGCSGRASWLELGHIPEEEPVEVLATKAADKKLAQAKFILHQLLVNTYPEEAQEPKPEPPPNIEIRTGSVALDKKK